MLEEDTELRDRLEGNAALLPRRASAAAGFDVRPGMHPIVPIMLCEEARAVGMAGGFSRRAST